MNCTDYWYIKFGVHIEEGYYVMTYLVCLEVCRHVAIFITLFLCSVQFADVLQFCWPYFYPLCLIRCVLQTCCSFPDLIFILCVWFAVSCRLLQFWWPYFYTLCLICCVLQFWWHYFYTLCLICWVLLTCCSFYDFIFILWVWFSVCCWLVAVFMTLFLYFVFDLLCVADLLQFWWPFIFYTLCWFAVCCRHLMTLFLYFVLIRWMLQFWWPYIFKKLHFVLICWVLRFWWSYFYTLCWFAVCCRLLQQEAWAASCEFWRTESACDSMSLGARCLVLSCVCK